MTSKEHTRKAPARAAARAKGGPKSAKPQAKRGTKSKSYRDRMRPELAPERKPDDRQGGTLLIPTPTLIDEQVRTVPKGKLITPTQIRERLARAHQVDRTCPLCTGIFLNIVAGAAEEDRAAGTRAVAPYWRVVKENGSLCEKFPAGLARQAALLAAEGHAVVPPARGKVPRVQGFERRLVRD